MVVFFLLVSVINKTNGQQNTNLINEKLSDERLKNGWLESDISGYRVSDEYTDKETGFTYTYVQQRHHNIAVYNAISVFLIKDNKVVSFTPGFIENLGGKVKSDKPLITAEAAIGYALIQMGRTDLAPVKLIRSDKDQNTYTFVSPGISASPIKVQLVYRGTDAGVFLCWDVSIELINEPHWWNVRVNALTGDFIDKNDFTANCSFDSHSNCKLHIGEMDEPFSPPAPLPPPPVPAEYTVFPFPVEAPSFGSRSLLSGPSDNIASSFGWHDDNGATGAEYTITRGNNVYAYEDANNDNLPGYSPNSGTLQFNYPLDLAQAPLVNQDASITNLFYVNNRIHDVLYHNGFTEAAGNFQQNNYGNGGLGNDYVKAEAFDGSGSNNANFSTPADGASGRMQMYLWTAPNPDRDGSFDNGIVAHEYGHGVSNRLTGGPSQAGCLGNAEQGGEGWSDWLALMLSTESTDIPGILTQARGIGTYALNQATTGVGIRRFRYSVDMSINPQTYADLATSSGPHAKGEIWCDAIWDMSCFLMNDFGFSSDPTVTTAGNNIALRLVLEGMKLQPCSPGYIDGRDAILLADQNLYGNAHRCRIWEAFARRGMGFGASQGSSTSSTDQTVSFALPTFCLVANQAPIAGFTSNSTSVACAGTVAFTDTSIQPFTWLWNFGDQTTSTIQNPSHAYNAPGTYTVKLVVTNPLGTDSATKVAYITVTPTFTVSASASPTSICPGNPVSLSGSGSGSNNVTYSVNSIPYAPLTGSGTTLTLADDVISTVQPIGFTFTFYGQNYTNFYVASNGFITFSSGQSAGVIYGPALPAVSSPNNLIALAWNDLYPPDPASVVDYFNTGVSPNKKLVIRYNTRHYGGAAYPFVVQAILSEGSNEIEIHTTTITNAAAFDPGATTTQGIENQTGTKATVVPGRNSTLFTASNDAYRFVPAVAYTYNWQPGNLNGAFQNVNPVVSGAYTVNVGDGSGCIISSVTSSVTVNPLPLPVISGNQSICAGSSTSLNAGLYSAYNWSTGATSQTISVATAGTFTVTVTDGNGCSGSTSVNTLVNALPTPSISGTLSFCSGNSTSLNAGLFSGYNWSNGSSLQTISVNTAGTYTVTVTGSNGCSGTSSVATTVNSIPTPVINGTLAFCSGSSTILDAGSFAGYSWSTGATTQTIPVNTAGTFSVTVTNVNGCTGSTSAVTVVNSCCNITLSGIVTPVTCSGGSTGGINVTSSADLGVASYIWNNGNTTEDRTGLNAGTYTVTVTYGPGCSQSQTFSVSQPSSLTVPGTVTSIVCRGINTGSIAISPGGGTAPYTYLWNNGSTIQNRTALSSGIYTVTVRDVNLCQKTATFSITQPATVLVLNTNKTNVRCANGITGSATVSPVGGVLPYVYAWNTIPVKTTATISALAAGVYTCTVTDAAGCVKNAVISITEPTVIIVLQTQSNISVPFGNDGTATVSVSGGTPGYTYSWNTTPVKTTATVTGLTAGTYKCTINDSKSCVSKVTFVLTEPANRSFTPEIKASGIWRVEVYPNPTTGLLTLNLVTTSDQRYMLSLESIAGQKMFKQSGHSISGENQELLDFSNIPKGIYILRVESDRNTFVNKLVLQ